MRTNERMRLGCRTSPLPLLCHGRPPMFRSGSVRAQPWGRDWYHVHGRQSLAVSSSTAGATITNLPGRNESQAATIDRVGYNRSRRRRASPRHRISAVLRAGCASQAWRTSGGVLVRLYDSASVNSPSVMVSSNTTPSHVHRGWTTCRIVLGQEHCTVPSSRPSSRRTNLIR